MSEVIWLSVKQFQIFCTLAIITHCVCVKRITLCNCLCSSSSSRFSVSLIRNIEEFGAKNYFTDHQKADTIHDFSDSFPVLKIQGYYGDTQKFGQLSIPYKVM